MICLVHGYLDSSRPGDVYIEGILPKRPYLPCVSMAGRALLAGYHRYVAYGAILCTNASYIDNFARGNKCKLNLNQNTNILISQISVKKSSPQNVFNVVSFSMCWIDLYKIYGWEALGQFPLTHRPCPTFHRVYKKHIDVLCIACLLITRTKCLTNFQYTFYWKFSQFYQNCTYILLCDKQLCRCYISLEQATGLDAWASRVKCPARFVSHLHDIYIYIWVVYSLCFFCCLFITVTWWYVWGIEWASGNQEEVQACLVTLWLFIISCYSLYKTLGLLCSWFKNNPHFRRYSMDFCV